MSYRDKYHRQHSLDIKDYYAKLSPEEKVKFKQFFKMTDYEMMSFLTDKWSYFEQFIKQRDIAYQH